MAGGDILLFACAAGALATLGLIFILSIAECREADPFAEPFGDCPWPVKDETTDGRKGWGAGETRPPVDAQVRFALHDGSATNR